MWYSLALPGDEAMMDNVYIVAFCRGHARAGYLRCVPISVHTGNHPKSDAQMGVWLLVPRVAHRKWRQVKVAL